jgi:formylglycine-generating enzyme required for sulfatase activity
MAACVSVPDSATTARTPQGAISDATHGEGTAGFYFLPPMIPRAPPDGELAAAATPTVRIDQINPATGASIRFVARFTATGGPVGERVRTKLRGRPCDPDDTDGDGDPEGYFVARWHSARDTACDRDGIYRVRVLVPALANGQCLSGRPLAGDGCELGFADVDIVRNRREFRTIDRDEFVPLIRGETLRIKFRIEHAAVDRDRDGALDWSDNCPTVANADQRDSVGDHVGDACRCLSVACRAVDSCHSVGVCNPTTGRCSTPALADGTSCDDGDACTQSDACRAGLCAGVSATPRVCVATDPRAPTATLRVPPGAAPAEQTFTVSVNPVVPPQVFVPSGGVVSVGRVVEYTAVGVTGTYHFAPGGPCAELEVPYDPALVEARAPSVQATLRVYQVVNSATVAPGGALDLALVTAPQTVDRVRHTVRFCTEHLSGYIPVVTDAACPFGQTNCAASGAGVACVRLVDDPANCGACGRACDLGWSCVSGECRIACWSTPALALCNATADAGVLVPPDDGGDAGSPYCARVANDPNNCGACHRVCASGQFCVGGVCRASCGAGLTPCNVGGADGGVAPDGGASYAYCADTAHDPSHCGACGNVCPALPNATTSCTVGQCALQECHAGFGNCDGDAGNGCERNLQTDNAHCGACGNRCAVGQVCSSGSCRDRALWVFSDEVSDPDRRETLVARSAGGGVTDLYVSVYRSTPNGAGRLMYPDEPVRDLIYRAHRRGLRVWAAYGDTDWASLGCGASAFPMERMAEVTAYNAAYPATAFDGVMLDVEAPQAQLRALLDLYVCARAALPGGVRLGAAIRFYWDDPVVHGGASEPRPAYQHILDLDLDRVVVMGYRDFAGPMDCSVDGILCLDRDEVAYASGLGRPGRVLVGLETSDPASIGEAARVTFFEEGHAVLDAEAQAVTDAFSGSSGFGGFAVHRYSNSYLSGSSGWPAFSDATGPERSCPDTGERGCGRATIAGGTFALGEEGPANGASPIQPAITVSEFVMDASEVTVARFRRYWEAGHPAPSSAVAYPGGSLAWTGPVVTPVTHTLDGTCNWTTTPGAWESHPLNCVDWATAQAFCVWDGGRLPTEAEWEYAARGRYGDARPYPWGAEAPTTTCDRAHWNHCAGEDGAFTRRVGSFATDVPTGLYDLGGNVGEWMADWRASYSSASCWGGLARTNPVCADSASGLRVLRGGQWNLTELPWLRVASRRDMGPGAHDSALGFRCVRAP